MKIYEYQNGSRIEVDSSQEPPDVTYAMGEYHVGDSYTTKTYHAFKANGEAKCFSNWYEAYKFRQG